MKNLKGCRIFYRYLQQLWEAGENEWGIDHILGGMQLLSDGSTADPAYAEDWNQAVEMCADPEDAYQVGMQFLRIWQEIGYAEDVARILSDMESEKRLDLWTKAVRDVEQECDDPYLRFADGTIPGGMLRPDLPHIVLIGDETFSLESFSEMHVPESIRCIRHENQLEIRYAELDYILLEEIPAAEIRGEYEPEDLAALPFDSPRWISVKCSNPEHVKRLISDPAFPADVIIDCCRKDRGLEHVIDRNRIIGLPAPDSD